MNGANVSPSELLSIFDINDLRRAARDLWTAGNNAGDGFDPGDLELVLVHPSRADDEVAIYRDDASGDVVLVGDANGPWAVRVRGAS
jgi:hypothetical protein